MKREFIVERQGRSFVLYAGILDLAHQQGLISIKTDLVQVPNDSNKNVAICTAIVVMEKDGVERFFTGIGDAAPNNVGPGMQTCLIRMAETRAKARALRDAVNIGTAAFEELGEEDVHEGHASAPVARSRTRQAPPPPEASVQPARRRCQHCLATNPAKGNHHQPGCPNRTEQPAAAAR